MPGESDYGGKAPLYPAGVGYDMASGLGTVNAANLANAIADSAPPADVSDFGGHIWGVESDTSAGAGSPGS